MASVARDLFLPVAARPSVDAFVSLAERADREGYDRVWLPETWGRDAVTVLTSIAHATDRVGIGTSVTNVYSRSPALVGQTAATLQEVSGGRFRLGLGPSGPVLVEGWHGVEYGNPLCRTREAIEVVRQVLSGETVEYDGEYFQLAGFRLRHDPPDPPPVDASGIGPTAVELAGRFGDGWHAFTLTREGLADRMADFRRGAQLGDRDPADQRVTVMVPCCALDDRERARYLVRELIAFYLGAMGTFYRESLTRQGYGETATEVTRRWANGEREAAIEAIDEDLLDALAAAGHPEECRDRLNAFEGIDGVDAVAVGFPRRADHEELVTTAERLAPSV